MFPYDLENLQTQYLNKNSNTIEKELSEIEQEILYMCSSLC